MVLILSSLLLALAATLVNAQDDEQSYVHGLVETLTNASLTSLAYSIGNLSLDGTSGQLLSTISDQSKNFTFFAPSNDGFTSLPDGTTKDTAAFVELLSYHFVFGLFSDWPTYPNTTIGRTALGNSTAVMLEGDKNQVIAWSTREDSRIHVLNQNATDDPVVVSKVEYMNLVIYGISAFAHYPGDLDATFKSNPQLSGLASLAEATHVSYWDTGDNTTSNASIAQVLSGVRGLTLFAPENDIITQGVSQFTTNTTQLWDVLRNHIINGTTVYSPSFVNSSHISAAGEEFYFTSNSTGSYVTSLNTTARVVQPDVLTRNGVIHIIDRVLVNSDVNETAAKDAYYSDSSLAGYSSTESGPVGIPTDGVSMLSVNGAIGNLKGANFGFGPLALSVLLGSSFLFAW